MAKVLIHEACGKPAVRQADSNQVILAGDDIRAGDWRHLDGRGIDPLEERRCDSCGSDLLGHEFDVRHIQEVI